ncbi:MAG: hypothetical protein ACOYNJ_02385 [Candidatus Nanopelagicales bacterium]
MKVRPAITLALSTAILASACTSTPEQATSTAPVESASPSSSGEVAAAGTDAADVQPWLAGPVDGGDATGPATPTQWPAVKVTGAGTSTSLTPTLSAPRLKGEVEVQVVSLAEGGGFGADGQGDASGIAFEGTGRADGIDLPAGTLTQGATYLWRAREGDGDWSGPWSFNVDIVRAQSAPTDTMGGVQVNLLSGVPAVGWESPNAPGALGALNVALVYRAGQPSVAGLPAGWVWALPGSGALELRESEQTGGDGDDKSPLSVTLVFGTGAATTFVRTETGAYVPGLADGTATRYSQGGLLTRVGDGIWQYMGADGSVSRYQDGRPVAEWAGGAPVATFQWDDQGRLTSVGDGVSRTMSMSYGSSCPAAEWGGGFGVPEGMWCATTNPDGSTTAVGYVGDQIGMIADAGGISSAFGWDAAGRLSAVRSSDASAAGATGGDTWKSADLTTQIAYDGKGRVASLTSAAAAPGGKRVIRTYSYPTEANGGQLTASANQVSGEVDNGTVMRLVATSDTWQVVSRTDINGRSSKAVYDEATGALIGGTDNAGRTMTMKVDPDTVVRSSIGPYKGSSDTAMRTDRIMDATPTDPSRGANSPVKAWQGLAANVWAGDSATPMWWDRSVLTDGLGGKLNFDGAWTAQATGTWQASESGEWVFAIESSDNLSVDVTVDGARCTDAEGKDGCIIKLKSGPHALAIAIEGEGRGSFTVKAGRGSATDISLEDLTPDYGAATIMTVNDTFDGANLGTQLLDVSRPWTSSPDTVTVSGDLTTSFAYEQTAPTSSQWGRMTGKTTPGGSQQNYAYYGDEEQATDPCTGTSYPQAGLPKTVTRYDGVTITTVYNASGLPVSRTTVGADNEGEQVCTSYDDAGRMLSTTLADLGGKEMNAASARYFWQDGLLTVSSTETANGATFTTVSVSDSLGQVLSYTDPWGVTSTYTYGAQGQLITRTTTAKDASAPALIVDYDFDTFGQLVKVTANGETYATVTYGQDELPVSISYPGGVVREFTYDTAGAVAAIRLTTRDKTYATETRRNEAGRILSTGWQVKGDGVLTESEWSYGYDDAGRLVDAVLTTKGDTAVSGDKKRTFTYDYGSPEDCPSRAGANFDRTGGTRDGVAYVTCVDGKGRLDWTTDPQLAPEGGKAKATWDGLGRLTDLDATTPLSLTWAGATQVASVTQGTSSTSVVVAGSQVVEQTVDGTVTRFGYSAPGASAPTLVMTEAGAISEIRLGLPGGAQAILAPEGALQRIDHLGLLSSWLTSTGADGTAQGAGEAALAPRYGPFGEPLVTMEAPASAMTYGWQAGARNQSLGGAHDLTLSARPYHPWLGQFLAFDPVAGSSPSGYGYADADPLNKPDYSGNFGLWEWVGVVGGVVATIGGLSAGSVAGTTSMRAFGLTTGAMMLGSAAATIGIVGTWLEGESTQSSVIVTAVAALGVALSVRGGWNWNKNYMSKRSRLYAFIGDANFKADMADEFADIQALKEEMGRVRAGGPPTPDRLAAIEDLHSQIVTKTTDLEELRQRSATKYMWDAAKRNGDNYFDSVMNKMFTFS